MFRRQPLALPLATIFFLSTAAATEFKVERHSGGVTVTVDGQPFTEYLVKSGSKPILWPLLGPGGAPLTRAYPMQKVAGEADDHVHHRSLWFTHGKVNGVDFWMEGDKAGTIEHREFVAVKGGTTASIVTRNDWLSPDGKRVLADERRLEFGLDGELRWIDFAIDLQATDGPVTFGDTKEGSFGLRVAESMKVDARKSKLGGGHILNSEGHKDDKAWGQRAAWVDYSGPVVKPGDDRPETFGIAVLNHPKSFRFPTHWHVRTYGLFAANPFGWHDFTGQPQGAGDHTIPVGESITLRYRVLLHKGDATAAKISDRFAKYAQE